MLQVRTLSGSWVAIWTELHVQAEVSVCTCGMPMCGLVQAVGGEREGPGP